MWFAKFSDSSGGGCETSESLVISHGMFRSAQPRKSEHKWPSAIPCEHCHWLENVRAKRPAVARLTAESRFSPLWQVSGGNRIRTCDLRVLKLLQTRTISRRARQAAACRYTWILPPSREDDSTRKHIEECLGEIFPILKRVTTRFEKKTRYNSVSTMDVQEFLPSALCVNRSLRLRIFRRNHYLLSEHLLE